MSESKFQDNDKLEYLQDDEEDYTFSYMEDNSECKSNGIKMPTSPLLKGMDLDLSFAEGMKRVSDNYEGIQEESVIVIFDLPDGSQGESMFKLGQTVEVLKSFIESEYGIPMEKQTLYLDDKVLMNPLSLLDYPEAKGVEELFVRVDGELDCEYRK